MDLKEKLIYLRKQHKLSQQDLAEQLDISRQTISKWEQGSSPTSDNLYQLAKLYGVSTDALLNDELSVELVPEHVTGQVQKPPEAQPAPQEMPPLPPELHSAKHRKRLIAAVIAGALLCGILLGIALSVLVMRKPEGTPIKDMDREVIIIDDVFDMEP